MIREDEDEVVQDFTERWALVLVVLDIQVLESGVNNDLVIFTVTLMFFEEILDIF
jgi:hypothetical protein